jgi:hypothetical protein
MQRSRSKIPDFVIKDNKSFNGTLINGQRISSTTPLYHKDEIQLGLGGPVLMFNAPGRVAPQGASLAAQRSVHAIEERKLQPIFIRQWLPVLGTSRAFGKTRTSRN